MIGQIRHIVIVGLILFSVTVTWAQEPEIPARVNAQNRTGPLPFSTTIGSDIERVDIASGNLIVDIPFISLPGRGMDFNFGLTYNAMFWYSAPRTNIHGQDLFEWKLENRGPAAIALGWSETRPRVSSVLRKFPCNLGGLELATYKTNFIYHDPQGGKHPMAVQKSVSSNCLINDPVGPDLTAEGMRANMFSEFDANIHLADGMMYDKSAGSNAAVWRDSNGNLINDFDLKDTLGRQVVTITTPTNQRIYRVTDSNGVQRDYTVNLGTINVATAFNVPALYCPGYLGVSEFNASPTVVTSITLPNNTTYSFQYEAGTYGALTRIDLPTGGRIDYTWTTVSDYEKTYRRVASRTVTVGGQSYTWTFNNGVVTDPNDNQTVFGIGPGSVIDSAAVYQGQAGGTLLRSYQVEYHNDSSSNPYNDPWYDGSACAEPQPVGVRPVWITTTLDDGKVSKTEFDYETFTHQYHPFHGLPNFGQAVTFTTSRGNVNEIREYGYGQGTPGGLLRRTTRTYLHNVFSIYVDYNIVSKILSETVYDAAATQKARTEYEYDTTPLTTSPGSPQHLDEAYSISFLWRGNPAKVKRWRDTDGAMLTTSYIYDTLGNILSITNPRGYTTNYSYTDQWANAFCPPPSNSRAYVTNITHVPTNHRVALKYYPCSGLKQARQDENDLLNSRAGATFLYDLLGRLTQTDYPDGGRTTLAYTEPYPQAMPPIPFRVTTTTKINATLNRVNEVEYDGLARPRVTRLTSDPQGMVYTRTVYDGLGRMIRTWNPTRCDPDLNPVSCANEATYGITETQYDALGRVTMVLPPDGNGITNNILTTYSGNTATVRDQALKERQSTTDAPGRLTQVIEDPTGAPYTTSYAYDVLDNLTSVAQGVQTRTFTYDSLSQLRTAANPESGAIQYPLYDANGNLERRIDARGTQTNYAYDSLDRLTTKAYTVAGGAAATPNVTYTYDSLATNCNSKGRLTSVTTSSPVSTTTIGCYDSMGRVTQQTQTTLSTNFAFSYMYDLAGNLTVQQYPSGKIVNTSIDGAGRIETLLQSGGVYYAGDATNAIKYAPHGGLMQMKLGNGLWEQARFNKRLQLNHIGIGQGADPLTSASLTAANANRLLLTNCLNSSIDPSACSGSATTNNGNVWRQQIQIQDAPSLTLTQNFTYDAVNRLTSVAESGGSNHCPQTYGHDQYGNHWVSAGAACGNTPNLTPTAQGHFVASTNRLIMGTSAYDFSGNLTTDATGRTFSYDAENRQTSYIAGQSSLNATYEYDGEGKRVKQIQNGITTVFVYDARGQLAAEYGTQPPSVGGTQYLTADHLGSTRIATSATGTTLTRHDYLPFGDEIAATYGGRSAVAGYGATTNLRQKFTGKERDVESGLDYFLARYYSGAQGRFMSPDEFTGGPIDAFSASDPLPPGPLPYADITDPQTLNKYAYVRNNPLRYTDPDGHCFDPFSCGVEFAGLGTLVGPGPGTAVGAVVGGVIGGAILYFGAKAVVDQIHRSDDSAKKNSSPPPSAGPQQQQQSTTATPPPPGSGNQGDDRTGGGKTGRKQNVDRAESATEKLAKAKEDLANLRKQNPRSKDFQKALQKAKDQVKHWAKKAAEKSEEHARVRQK